MSTYLLLRHRSPGIVVSGLGSQSIVLPVGRRTSGIKSKNDKVLIRGPGGRQLNYWVDVKSRTLRRIYSLRRTVYTGCVGVSGEWTRMFTPVYL